MLIQLTKDFLGNPAGHRLDVADADAQSLIHSGHAEPADGIEPTLEQSFDRALAKAFAKSANARSGAAGNRLPFAGLGDSPLDDPRAGFKNFGDFALAVRDACQPGKRLDDRLALVAKAPAGMGESSGTEGGFLVPQEFARKILERVYAGHNLLSRTDSYTISGNSIAFPRNAETSRANGSRWGGVRAYWREEGQQATASYPTFERLPLTLSKLFVLVHASDELLSDTQGLALEQYLSRVASEEINFVVSDAILNGSGTGQPLGVLESDALVVVDKETSQAAATVNAANLIKMWSRLWAPCRANAVWLINQEVESQLHAITIGTGSAAALGYLPPGGLSAKPYATLFGRPVLPVEWCPALGSEGDVILADFRHYVTISKGMVESALSIHLRFDYDESTFRFIFRVDGRPWWDAPLTPYKGSATQSAFVTLAERA